MGAPNVSRVMQRLQASRQRLQERGLPPEAISVAQRHPNAVEAIEAAMRGETLEAPRVEFGPRRGLRDGYGCECGFADGRQVWRVVRYSAAGRWKGAPYGEERKIVWTTDG